MERFREIIYQGQNILVFDHRGMRGDEFLHNLKAGTQWLRDHPGDELLTLADFTGFYATDEVVAYLQSEESKIAAQNVKKSAAVGVTGIKKIFLNLYNLATGSSARAFDDLEAAKTYLISS